MPSSDQSAAAAVLFDGGAASVLATIRMAEKAERLHLLTFVHPGLESTDALKAHRGRLVDHFGDESRLLFRVIPTNNLWRHLTESEGAWGKPSAHGLVVAATCELCRLVFHWRALIYCLDNGIQSLADGRSEASLPGLAPLHRGFGVSYEPLAHEPVGETLYALRYSRSPAPEPSAMRCNEGILQRSAERLWEDHAEYQRRVGAWLGARLPVVERMTREYVEKRAAAPLAALIERDA